MKRCYTDHDGNRIWEENGRTHREDGPAVEMKGGTLKWVQYGKLHRTDGPAVIEPSGYLAYYLNGKRHREDGPAVIGHDYEAWYLEHRRHRVGGPAVVYKSTSTQQPSAKWYLFGDHIKSFEAYQELSGMTDEDMFLMILKYGEIK